MFVEDAKYGVLRICEGGRGCIYLSQGKVAMCEILLTRETMAFIYMYFCVAVLRSSWRFPWQKQRLSF